MESSDPPARGKEVIGNLVNEFKSALKKGSTSHDTEEPSCPAGEQQSSALASEQTQEIQDTSSREDPEVIMQLYEAPPESSSVIEVDTFDGCDRTQVLLAKNNFDLAHSRWPARNIIPVERVSKPIRMRVRYTCHRCKTSFGHNRECNSCRHRRCARCDRYPARGPRPNPDSHGPASALAAPAAPVEEVVAEEVVDEESGPVLADCFCTCHECQTVIEVEVDECPNCHHTICAKCHTEARLQSIDEPSVDLTPPTEEEERISQPEEQKLPPDSSTAEEEQPTLSR